MYLADEHPALIRELGAFDYWVSTLDSRTSISFPAAIIVERQRRGSVAAVSALHPLALAHPHRLASRSGLDVRLSNHDRAGALIDAVTQTKGRPARSRCDMRHSQHTPGCGLVFERGHDKNTGAATKRVSTTMSVAQMANRVWPRYPSRWSGVTSAKVGVVVISRKVKLESD